MKKHQELAALIAEIKEMAKDITIVTSVQKSREPEPCMMLLWQYPTEGDVVLRMVKVRNRPPEERVVWMTRMS